MDLKHIQNLLKQFEEARGWDKFPSSQVFAHLIEELGEISRYITTEEGYKVVGLGHEQPKKDELSREFAQVFSLFIQLANHFDVDIESSVLSELEYMKERFPEGKWKSYMNNR
jgi:NTP pyrophosphatase (non-canonical NTP hydrolase)